MTDPVTEEYRQNELNREWLKNNDLASAGGGSTPGAVRVLQFPFDFSMAADLATGVTVYTPAVGDWLLDAWIQNDDTGWLFDGMVIPLADIGVVDGPFFADTGGGLFARFTGAIELSNVTWTVGTKLIYGPSATTNTGLMPSSLIAALGAGYALPQVKFLSTDPLSLVVSDDGTPSGDAFDGSAGSSTLYIVVCTPGDAS